ncbi:MAG: hypothetical protein R2747_23490 [Pyrinomonadaceae bacterium]
MENWQQEFRRLSEAKKALDGKIKREHYQGQTSLHHPSEFCLAFFIFDHRLTRDHQLLPICL